MLSVFLLLFRINEWLNLLLSCRLCFYNYGMLIIYLRIFDFVSDIKNSDFFFFFYIEMI